MFVWGVERLADAEKKSRYQGAIRTVAIVGMIATGILFVTAVLLNGDEMLEGLRAFWP
ncbi:MAG: hypothetical protein AAF078_04515 [Planctomycetota bacterium]